MKGIQWAKIIFFLVMSNYCLRKIIAEPLIDQDKIEKIAEQVAEKTAQKIVEKITKINSAEPEKNIKDKSQKITKDLSQKKLGKKILRIGSGALGGNYFVLGGLIGGVISYPLVSLACGQGGTCGL